MTTLRNALFASCLALPLLGAGAHAQTIEQGGRVIQVPPGAVVLIVPASGAVAAPAPAADLAGPIALPILQLMADQQAAMEQMIASMHAMGSMGPAAMMPGLPGPSQLIQAAFDGPLLNVTAGPGVCSESISIVQHGNAAPVVTRTATGDCGSAASGQPDSVRALQPAPLPQQDRPRMYEMRALPPAPQPANQPRTLDISYPPQPVPGHQPPRT